MDAEDTAVDADTYDIVEGVGEGGRCCWGD